MLIAEDVDLHSDMQGAPYPVQGVVDGEPPIQVGAGVPSNQRIESDVHHADGITGRVGVVVQYPVRAQDEGIKSVVYM